MHTEKFHTEKEEKIPLQMYEVSGFEAISEHSLSRYMKDKEQDTAIRKKAPYPFSYRLKLQEDILRAPERKRATMIAEALKIRDIAVQKAALEVVGSVPECDEEKLSENITRAVEQGPLPQT
jgi:hypothetical protein